MNKELIYDADELISIAEDLKKAMSELSEAVFLNFTKMKSEAFYTNGRATEEMDRILSKDARAGNEMVFTLGVAGDYYGKLQMLLQYYTILSEYCYQSMITVQEHDKKIASYIEQITNVNETGG